MVCTFCYRVGTVEAWLPLAPGSGRAPCSPAVVNQAHGFPRWLSMLRGQLGETTCPTASSAPAPGNCCPHVPSPAEWALLEVRVHVHVVTRPSPSDQAFPTLWRKGHRAQRNAWCAGSAPQGLRISQALPSPTQHPASGDLSKPCPPTALACIQ